VSAGGDARDPALVLSDGLWFRAGPETWALEPLSVMAGEWSALVPDGAEPVVDPSVPLARVLCSLSDPLRGTVEIIGRDVSRMDYGERQRLRARLGFVQGYGGLLSNRTLRENVSLPVSVHGGLSFGDEVHLVDSAVRSFALDRVAHLRPHEVDGSTRWRACVARSLVLSPLWLVLEGIGDWEMDRGRGVTWTRLGRFLRRGGAAAAVCLSRQNPEFEAWFEEGGGVVARYARLPDGEAPHRERA